MDKKLIKTFDSQKAKELAKLGFKYILDRMNGQSVYTFFVSEELLKYINSKYETNDFFYENILRF